MAQRINRRQMQRKYMMRRIMLLVLLLLLVGGGGWLLGSGILKAEGAEKDDPDADADLQGASLDVSQVESANSSAPVEGINVNPDQEPDPEPEPEPDLVITGDDDWQLRLASAANPLPPGYAPPELATVGDGYQVDSRIASDLQRMINDARMEDIVLIICSAYRTEEYQTGLYENKVQEHISYGRSEEEARAVAGTIVALPGTSEHQTGLAVDIVTPAYQTLDDGFADTPAAKWMAENSWRYGFVLRYPEDKQDVTKIIYEPWHFRYVGYEHAKIMYEKGYCLEEYLYIERNSLQPSAPATAATSGDESSED